MYIQQIKLLNFRNYEELELAVKPGTNILYGNNAQGKTNVLEAIYLCTCARSHRTAKDSDLIMNNASSYAVRLEFSRQIGVNESLEIRYFMEDPKTGQRGRSIREIYHNDLKLDKVSDLMGLFHAVIFAPEDLLIIKEGPATRRRYLDMLISQVEPPYFVYLQQYYRILAQRNNLLKKVREFRRTGRDDSENLLKTQLEVWNESLASVAVKLVHLRQKYTKRIADLAGNALSKISDYKENLKIRYRTVPGINPDSNFYGGYLKKLELTADDDIEKGITQIGPHRDDLEITLDGLNIKIFASQGQQRSVVLALKIAELKLLKELTGEMPVFLLDDVMSELDFKRRQALLENMDNAQVFITCTDAKQVQRELCFKENGLAEEAECGLEHALYYVENGTVTP